MLAIAPASVFRARDSAVSSTPHPTIEQPKGRALAIVPLARSVRADILAGLAIDQLRCWRSRMKAGYGADSGPSRGDPRGSGVRPKATFEIDPVNG
jgi:hypothetical protein